MENRHHFSIGDFHCLAINDGDYPGDAGMLFANAPEEALARALQEHDLQPDHLPSTWTCLLVETGDHVVLIDAGAGDVLQATGGRLRPALAAEGFAASDIDTVVITHGHGDHIGGCIDAEGRPAFPEARYVMWQSEWDFWRSEENLAQVSAWAARVARNCLLPVAPLMETINTEAEIVPGIRAVAAPGHTVGHIALEITSAGESLLYMADAALHPIHLEHPEWVATVDGNAEQTVASRRALCRRAARRDALVLAFHFAPFPSLGRIMEAGEAWTWEPL